LTGLYPHINDLIDWQVITRSFIRVTSQVKFFRVNCFHFLCKIIKGHGYELLSDKLLEELKGDS